MAAVLCKTGRFRRTRRAVAAGGKISRRRHGRHGPTALPRYRNGFSSRFYQRDERGPPKATRPSTAHAASAWSEKAASIALRCKADFHIKGRIEHQSTNSGRHNFRRRRLYLQYRAYELRLHGGGIHLDKISGSNEPFLFRERRTFPLAGRADRESSTSSKPHIPQFQVRDQVISSVAAQISVEHQNANVTLHSVIDQGSVDAKGGSIWRVTATPSPRLTHVLFPRRLCWPTCMPAKAQRWAEK